MRRDNVSEVTKNDNAILHLGQSCLERSIHNAKAKYTASQHMLFAARLLMNLLDIYDEKYLNKAREDKELPTNHVDHHTQI